MNLLCLSTQNPNMSFVSKSSRWENNTLLLAAASTTVSVIVGATAFYSYWQQQQHCSKKSSPSSKYTIPADIINSTLAVETQVAVQLALEAGCRMYAYCNEKGTAAELHHDLGIAEKGQPEDFYTKIDVENEHYITDSLLHHFPHHKIIGEESTGTGAIPKLTKEHPTWIIDPIDGTTNFASGLPLTCVSIGLCVEGKPVLGVVYAPMTDELYIAVSGLGAYRNGVAITQRTSKRLAESVVCFEFGYARENAAIDKMLTGLSCVLKHGCRSTRSLGTGVLDLCYVATGRIDVVYAGLANEGWKPWDYCAGLVIAQEAGCVIEAIDQKVGQDFDLYSNSIICAVSKSLVKELRECITKA